MLAAVKQDGDALEYASTELQNNEKIVLAAVTQWKDALKFASKELRNLIIFENGKPTTINKINKDIQKANKILDSDANLYEEAEKNKLISSLPFSSSLMYNPVSLRTFDIKQNRQIHEQPIYDREQVDKFNQHKSPFTRRDIIQIVQQKKKKQEILEFVKEVIAPKQKKQTKKDQKKISTPYKYNTRSRKKK